MKKEGEFMSKIDVNANGCIFTGLEFENHLEFRGIRYARAQRWEYPKMCDYENGCFNACEFGNCSPQYRAFEDDAVVNSFSAWLRFITCLAILAKDCFQSSQQVHHIYI